MPCNVENIKTSKHQNIINTSNYKLKSSFTMIPQTSDAAIVDLNGTMDDFVVAINLMLRDLEH